MRAPNTSKRHWSFHNKSVVDKFIYPDDVYFSVLPSLPPSPLSSVLPPFSPLSFTFPLSSSLWLYLSMSFLLWFSLVLFWLRVGLNSLLSLGCPQIWHLPAFLSSRSLELWVRTTIPGFFQFLLLVAFLLFFGNALCIWVFPWLHGCIPCARRPEKNAGSSGSGVIGSCEPPCRFW